MSGPILITTSTYNGPERRGKFMVEHDEKRQTNEVAIARLEVNVEYIKQAVDEIKQRSCDNCVTAAALREHREDHKLHADAKRDRIRYIITTAIAVLALAITVFSKIPAATARPVSSASVTAPKYTTTAPE